MLWHTRRVVIWEVRRRRHIAWDALFTSAEVLLTMVVAHVVAGGHLPDALALLGAAVPTFVASLLVLGRGLRVRTALPLLIGAQFALHLWLVVGTSGTGHASEHALSVPMVGAHLLAAVVAALSWLLRRQAVDSILRCALPQVLPVAGLLIESVPLVSGPRSDGGLHPGCPRRGPPDVLLTA